MRSAIAHRRIKAGGMRGWQRWEGGGAEGRGCLRPRASLPAAPCPPGPRVSAGFRCLPLRSAGSQQQFRAASRAALPRGRPAAGAGPRKRRPGRAGQGGSGRVGPEREGAAAAAAARRCVGPRGGRRDPLPRQGPERAGARRGEPGAGWARCRRAGERGREAVGAGTGLGWARCRRAGDRDNDRERDWEPGRNRAGLGAALPRTETMTGTGTGSGSEPGLGRAELRAAVPGEEDGTRSGLYLEQWAGPARARSRLDSDSG